MNFDPNSRIIADRAKFSLKTHDAGYMVYQDAGKPCIQLTSILVNIRFYKMFFCLLSDFDYNNEDKFCCSIMD
jgi:hypothetical protein